MRPTSAIRTTFLVGLLVAALFLPQSDTAAQTLRPAEEGFVSVTAEGVPLEDLLRQFSAIAALRLWLQPGLGDRLVSVSSEPVAIVEALRRVLRAADVDFVLSGGVDGRPIRLVVGESNAPEVTALQSDPVSYANEEPMAASTEDGVEPEVESASDAPPLQAGGPLGPEIPSGISPADRLVQLLAPTGRPKAGPGEWLTLPFLRPDGQPYTVQNIPPPAGVARLPFPDANGQPLEIFVPPPTPGVFTVPFPGPDGQPYTFSFAPPPVSRRPPGGR
jgi:hypothetical protein